MGARGIKRRKPKRELPSFVDHLPPGDQRRVFGQFENSMWSPMGGVERSWFFGRQLRRGSNRHPLRQSLLMLWWSLPIILGFIALCMILAFVVQHA